MNHRYINDFSSVKNCCLVFLLLKMSRKTMEDRMEKIEDIRPTAELSPEMIKTICDAISQEFYRWELKEEDAEIV